MPSEAHHWLTERIKAGQGQAAPALAQERAAANTNGALAPPPESVTEPITGQDGALLFEPASPREDVVLFHIHGGGVRIGTAAHARTPQDSWHNAYAADQCRPSTGSPQSTPFAAGLDDCVEVCTAVRAAFPDTRVVVAGDSAGADTVVR
ncbi:hypothetical protein ACIPX0_45715 [Streptomyces sp. NPDC090075]|uniref:hypothetical protein n=1 Tax=Streptomyces sp. NPDC090075 TaxID=3365937 RepID=UPI0037FEE8E8